MLTLCVTPRDELVTDTTGHTAYVKTVLVYEEESGLQRLRDLEPSLEYTDVTLWYMRRRFPKLLTLTKNVRRAIIEFMREHHSRQNIAFDCYAFVNLIEDVEQHEKRWLYAYWSLKTLPKRPRPGDVVVLLSGRNQIHHAAVFLGSGLYLSVWGAGGDLEVATLKAMMRDFGSTKPRIARPRTSVTS